MKPRERVEMALNREVPDRCPMQISFTPEFAQRLRDDLALGGRSLHNPHGGGNTYELERALGEDLLLTSVGWANSYYLDDKPYVDEWGVQWAVQAYETPFGIGHYTEIAGHPLADRAALGTYLPPDPNRPELYVDAEAFQILYKESYDKKGELWKIMLNSASYHPNEEGDDILGWSGTLVIDVQAEHATIFHVHKARGNTGLNPDMFTVSNLRKRSK